MVAQPGNAPDIPPWRGGDLTFCPLGHVRQDFLYDQMALAQARRIPVMGSSRQYPVMKSEVFNVLINEFYPNLQKL